MNWTNVVRVPYDLWRFRTQQQYDHFATELSRACDAPALWVGYSDTAGASSVVRFADGVSKVEDDGWDVDSLDEAIGAMEEAGEKVPAQMKKRLKQLKSGAATSVDLKKLALKERFLCGAFGSHAEPGKPCLVEFIDYPRDSFEAVWFVSR